MNKLKDIFDKLEGEEKYNDRGREMINSGEFLNNRVDEIPCSEEGIEILFKRFWDKVEYSYNWESKMYPDLQLIPVDGKELYTSDEDFDDRLILVQSCLGEDARSLSVPVLVLFKNRYGYEDFIMNYFEDMDNKGEWNEEESKFTYYDKEEERYING